MKSEGGRGEAPLYQCLRCAQVMEKPAALGQVRSGKQLFTAALCRVCIQLFSARSIFERTLRVIRGKGERPCHEEGRAPSLTVVRS